MSAISIIGRTFEVAGRRQRATGTGVYLNPVEDRRGDKFAQRVSDLARESQRYEDSRLLELIGAARAIRWLRSVDPTPMNSGSYGGSWIDTFMELAQTCAPSLQGMSLEALLKVRESIEGLSAEQSRPLAQAIVEDLHELGDDCAIIVPRAAAVEPLREWLSGEGVDATERIFAPTHLGQAPGRFWDTIICLGEPRKYDAGERNFLTALVTCPISETLSFLYPSWSRPLTASTTEILSTGLIGEIDRRQPIYRATRTETRVREPEEIDRLIPSAAAIQEATLDDADFAIDANSVDAAPIQSGPPILSFRIRLGLGYTIFVDEKAERLRGVDLANNPPTLRSVPIESLEPGNWLAARLDSSEVMELRGRALALLAESAHTVSDSQEDWKLRLSRRGERSGWSSVSRGLRNSGVKVVGQERRWATSMAIRPRSDSDFSSLLKYLDYTPLEQETAIHLANRLRGAVSIASRQLSNELADALSGIDASDVRDGLVLEVRRRDSTSYRVLIAPVLDVSDELVEVRASQLRRAIRELD